MAVLDTIIPQPVALNAPVRSVGKLVGRAVKSMQYARMRTVFEHMSDRELEDIGVTRADIENVAHNCVYDR